MADTGAKWQPRDDDALAVGLAARLTIADAAKRAGCSPRTAARRIKDPGFQARVRELRADATRRTSIRLAEMVDAACDALQDLLSSSDTSEGARLRAAQITLELHSKARAEGDLLARLERLERAEARRA